MPSNTLILKDTCTRDGCKGKGTYRMKATCGNCQTAVILEITKGHTTPTYAGGPECPVCGNKEWAGFVLA